MTILYGIYCIHNKGNQMPQVTVYVREDDLDKWKAIEKKAEWLSDRLNQPMITLKAMPNVMNILPEQDPNESHDIRPDRPVNSPEESKAIAEEVVSNEAFKAFMGKPPVKYCKHGSAIGLCKFGCKK